MTKKAVTTHAMSARSTPRSFAMVGIAMLTMLMFMTESHMPLATTTRAYQRRRGCAARRARISRALVVACAITRGV